MLLFCRGVHGLKCLPCCWCWWLSYSVVSLSRPDQRLNSVTERSAVRTTNSGGWFQIPCFHLAWLRGGRHWPLRLRSGGRGELAAFRRWTRGSCGVHLVRYCLLGFRGLCRGWYLFRVKKRRESAASVRESESKPPYLGVSAAG